jgi:hypothetical protein
VPRSVFEFGDPFTPTLDTVDAAADGDYRGATLAAVLALTRLGKVSI